MYFVPVVGCPSNPQFPRFCCVLRILVDLALHVQETGENLGVGTIFELAVLSHACLSVLVKGSTKL